MGPELLIEELFQLSGAVRYVAVYQGGELTIRERPTPVGASSLETDRFEELLVNPTLITLVRQRGEIDCGGLRHVLIRYGNFYQLVVPVAAGHVSVALEPDAASLGLAASLVDHVERWTTVAA